MDETSPSLLGAETLQWGINVSHVILLFPFLFTLVYHVTL